MSIIFQIQIEGCYTAGSNRKAYYILDIDKNNTLMCRRADKVKTLGSFQTFTEAKQSMIYYMKEAMRGNLFKNQCRICLKEMTSSECLNCFPVLYISDLDGGNNEFSLY